MDQVNINDLKGNPQNPRTISKHDYEALVNSIKRFGDLSGIVFNRRTGQLVGGHQRIEAFKRMGGDKSVQITERLESPNAKGTVAVGYVYFENEQYAYREVDWDQGTENAANIAANRIQGQFDLDLLAKITYEISQLENGDELLGLTGQTTDEINRLLDSVGAGGDSDSEDDAPEVDDQNPPVSKPGEIYQLGPHRLMCGDATSLDDVQALMGGKQADMIWTDPPYNVAYEGKTADALTIQNDSFKDSAAFYDFLYLAFSNQNAVTKPGGSMYICHADSEGLNFRKAMADAGFLFKQCIIWNKNTMVLGRQDYQWKHEPILYGWKDGGTHYFVPERDLTTVWDFDKPAKSEDHPTMKPIALVKHAINNSSKRGEIVLDTFAGSGSMMVAADLMGRVSYNMELDPKYCDVIRKRYAKQINSEDWQQATPVISEETSDAPATEPAPTA